MTALTVASSLAQLLGGEGHLRIFHYHTLMGVRMMHACLPHAIHLWARGWGRGTVQLAFMFCEYIFSPSPAACSSGTVRAASARLYAVSSGDAQVRQPFHVPRPSLTYLPPSLISALRWCPSSMRRSRDCHDCDTLLLCSTRPIIESSTNVRTPYGLRPCLVALCYR
jgi:hypothetical protein